MSGGWCFYLMGVTLLQSTILTASTPKAELPPGVAYLEKANEGKGFELFIEEAMRESETFRRQVLAGQDKDFLNTDLLAAVINQFCETAPSYLQGRKGIAGFQQSPKALRQAFIGKGPLVPETVYGGFTGKWFGKWDQMRVDHHWGRITRLEPPQQIAIPGNTPVFLRSYQYCWVGDGYGLNVIASAEAQTQAPDFLLGYVVHVRDGDMNQPTERRPHVGVYVSPGKLIWITAGEVFLEESYQTDTGVDAYAITGFFYRVKDRCLETKGCFQAHYTRDPRKRPDWYSFSLGLKVKDPKVGSRGAQE